MDYINAFWVGGLILCPGSDTFRQDKAAAGPCYGAAGMYRSRTGVCGHLQQAHGFCRCRCQRPPFGIRQPALERCKKSHR